MRLPVSSRQAQQEILNPRALEIISPPGFEHSFNELGETIATTEAKGPGDMPPHSDLPVRYAIEFQR